MTAASDILGPIVRNRMRTLTSTYLTLELIKAAWQAGRFASVPNPTSQASGLRKQLFDSYAEGVDWASDEQVQRACTAFGAMLRYCRPTEPDEGWDRRLAEIAADFRRDGFEITPGLDIRRQGEYRPEDAKAAEDAYREALRILRGARNAMTHAHRLTEGMGEDRLRDVLLVALNGYFEGRATAESLNGDGKTDILLRIADRNALIVECKMWRGSAMVEGALDQLLRYIDNITTRTALIYFMRTDNPGPLIEKAVTAIEAHPHHETTDRSEADTERQWSFTIRGNGSPGTATRAEVTFLPIVVA
ncbi:hypothetical protein [Streptomyces sp. fd1-xmd]|uniref:hypothetical protein n=1 Tax=Streptomyces sp. fd1-xmd TaxID=1812480 RepID=UPI0009903D74|nr:hypothetical protein [Streptomyces sp. fd1-xmd]AQT70366.1 hypothetical protein B1K54_00060 [Streptomyces sp. fd1-xmd]